MAGARTRGGPRRGTDIDAVRHRGCTPTPPPQVKGEGFIPGTKCRFGSGLVTPATVVTPELLRCTTSTTSFSTAGCQGGFLEAVLEGGATTANRVRLRRVATPSVLSLTPPRGFYNVTQNVTLHGYGFVASPHVTCRSCL